MALHEECGIFGIFSQDETDVAHDVYYGLYALQHRGQESCGIVVNSKGLFHSHKDFGLVGEAFSKEDLERLPQGKIAIGHVRYGTTGANTRANIQPMEVSHQKGRLAIAHNGNLTNAIALRDNLELEGAIFHSTSDTETICYIITKERLKTESIEDAVIAAMQKLEGAYSLVMMSATKMIAVRDSHGFRPLCYGKKPDGSYVVASESCALSAVGADFVRDIEPGEMLVFSESGISSNKSLCKSCQKRLCIFEYIYFARPDSEIDGLSVHAARETAGRILAKCNPENADVVIGVPDSGLDAAVGYAKEAGIPYGIGLIKNKYIGRTFISPGQKERTAMVRIKLSPVKETVVGKSIVLIDDSIVRGTTSRRIVTMLREAGAREIHLRISSPPFRHPCFYGVDIDSEDGLIANHHTTEEICKMTGADSLAFLPLDSLKNLCGNSDFCAACFDGRYPTKISRDQRKDRFENML